MKNIIKLIHILDRICYFLAYAINIQIKYFYLKFLLGPLQISALRQ